MARFRRKSLGKRMGTIARRTEQRELGKWSLAYGKAGIQGPVGGGAVQAAIINIGVTLSTPNPVTIYGFNLSAALALRDVGSQSNGRPVTAVLAITKLSAAERIASAPALGVIANPAVPDAANDRPWRFWMPFVLGAKENQESQSPYWFHPLRLPLRGQVKLDVGQRLAVIMALAPDISNEGAAIDAVVWGRYRYITHD